MSLSDQKGTPEKLADNEDDQIKLNLLAIKLNGLLTIDLGNKQSN